VNLDLFTTRIDATPIVHTSKVVGPHRNIGLAAPSLLHYCFCDLSLIGVCTTDDPKYTWTSTATPSLAPRCFRFSKSPSTISYIGSPPG
jgi:hypothetical protein